MSHESVHNLQKNIQSVSVSVGSKWYHHKNSEKIYVVIAVGLQESTEELCIIYKNELDDIVWVRNLNSFIGYADIDNKSVQRFILVK